MASAVNELVHSSGNGSGDLLRTLAKGATIETSTRNLAEIGDYSQWLDSGAEVFVAWVPGVPYHHLTSVARALRREGFVPVPHLVARRLASEAQARELLAALQGEAAVEKVLLVGGDNPQPSGPYADTLAVMDSGLLESHGVRRVCLGAFPEGHPKAAEIALNDALDARIQSARRSGIELRLVSQFCFDGSVIHRWLAGLRARGIDIPVSIGLAGPANLRTLLKFGAHCGIGASLRMLRGHAVSLTRLAVQEGPEPVAHGFASRLASAPLPGVEGFHLFSFGGVEASARWSRAMAEGRFRIDGSGLALVR